MFKKIQNHLLLKYPLLWNTKFVPMLVIGSILNIIYFGIGYTNGIIDFSGKIDLDIEQDSFLVFCAFFNSILLIIWLIYYVRNNSFYSFYAKKPNSLFYEYLQIFIICLLFSVFPLFYIIGKQEHQKSYLSKSELEKNLKIISKADFFIDGEFDTTAIDTAKSVEHDDYTETVNYDYIVYNGEIYNQYSLLNRKTFYFDNYTQYYYGSDYRDAATINNDSLIRTYLYSNNKTEVKKIMSDYLKVVQKHNIKTNLTVENWFKTVYHYPKFENYRTIRPYFKQKEINRDVNEYNTYGYQYYSPSNKEYSNLFVDQNLLIKNYIKILKAYTNKNIDKDVVAIILFFAFSLSLLIFSFRVTCFKKWLIALLSTGFFSLLIGLICALIYENVQPRIPEYYFVFLAILLVLCNATYLFVTISKNTTKKHTEISLNIFIWSFSFVLLAVYFIIADFLHIYSRDESNDLDTVFYAFQNNLGYFVMVNIFISIVFLYFFSKTIYKWKGISEH